MALENSDRYERYNKYGWFAIALLLYIAFPAGSHSVDAWGYATYARYGHHLFLPHHLGYTATLYIVVHLVQAAGVSAGAMGIALFFNGFTAWLCLFPLYRIISLLKKDIQSRFALLTIAAFSFGVWRFATENETYILPLLFSLWGSYFYIRAVQQVSGLWVFLSSLCGVAACLYHQMHIFWWIGLFAGLLLYSRGSRIRVILLYLLPSLLLPLAYILVLVLYEGKALSLSSLWHFVLHDVYTGAVGEAPGLKHLVLGVVNLLRSFFQVHGLIRVVVWKTPLFTLPGVVAAVTGILAVWSIIKSRRKLKRPAAAYILYPHIIIFLLQWLFAVYNVGNAEFMVMLPSLLVVIAARYRWPSKALVYAAMAVVVWNFFYGIWPRYYYRFDADEEIATLVQKKERSYFMLAEPGLVNNIVYYNTNTQPAHIIRSPGYYESKFGEVASLYRQVDSLLAAGVEVYTDVGGRPSLYSRASLLYDAKSKEFIKHYRLQTADAYPTAAGLHTVFRIMGRKKEN